MYIDLIVLIVLLILVVLFFNKFHSYVLFFGIVDITLRILAFINSNIPGNKISKTIGKYLPESIFDIIDKYTEGSINIALKWVLVAIMIVFLYYVFKIFWKKKRI